MRRVEQKILSFKEKILLKISIFVMQYFYAMLRIFGLAICTLNPKTNRLENGELATIYSILVGIGATIYFTFSTWKILNSKNIEIYFTGAAQMTGVFSFLVGIIVIFVFYYVQFVQRDVVLKYYNGVIEAFPTFSLFYGGDLVIVKLQYSYMESFEEVYDVYIPIFIKCVVNNSLNLICIFCMTWLNYTRYEFDYRHMFMFLGYPYMIQSIMSSFLYLGAIKIYYLLKKLNQKLEDILEEISELIDSNRSNYDKMTKFCLFSDQLDELGICVQRITRFAHDLCHLYQYQMLLILLYIIVNVLHNMIFQYSFFASYSKGNISYDPFISFNSFMVLVLNIVEIMWVIRTTDRVVRQHKRVAKTVHKILNFEAHFDIRLRQSVSIC